MKMKNIKKTLCVILAIALSTSCLTGCGGSKPSAKKGGEKEIEIRVWNSGYGTTYVENMKEAFLKKYPEYNIIINASVEALNPSWGLADIDTTDIYIGVPTAAAAPSRTNILRSTWRKRTWT